MNENKQVTLEELMQDKERYTTFVEKGEALKRLLENPDYQLIIGEGFFVEYAKEIAVGVAKNTGAYDPDILCGNLKGINTLHGYLHRVGFNHENAVIGIQEIEDYIKSGMSTNNADDIDEE